MSAKWFVVLALACVGNALSISKFIGAALTTRETGLVARDTPDGVVKLGFKLGTLPGNSTKVNLGKRYIQEPLAGYENAYYIIQLEVGSNKDSLQVVADTGSADLWVISPNTSCGNSNCGSLGTYDPSLSSTAINNHSVSVLDYGTAGASSYEYLEDWFDQVTLPGGPTVLNTSVGVALNGTVPQGILGLGRDVLEESVNSGGKVHDNFGDSLYKQGFTKSNAFSLYLESEQEQTGSILFGGIDHAKYSGELVSLPYAESYYLSVKLNSITSGSTTINTNIPALLDSGTPTFAFSPQTASQISSALGFFPSCSTTKTFNFNFNGISIPVPATEFLQSTWWGGCQVISFYQASSDLDILGAAFLRHAYAVFDISAQSISLAPVQYTSASNITAITS